MKQWFLFLFSRSFFKSLVRLGGGLAIHDRGTLVLSQILQSTRSYSGPAQFEGVHAEMKCKRSWIRSDLETIHLDSIYSRNGKPFQVIEQVPPPVPKLNQAGGFM
jgi:hypothetical protein